MNPLFQRRQALRLLALAAAAGSVSVASQAHEDDDDPTGYQRGKVFISTNAAAGNQVQVYNRAANGPATLLATVATQGTGTGAGLGSQGAVTLSGNGRYLFVVNAGSNTVSTFELGARGMVLKSTVASGGVRPTSVAENDGLVYVLNAPNGGNGPGNNVVGFRNIRGVLTPLADGTRALTDGTQPAQVSLDRDGNVLVVSERSARQLVSYGVRPNGSLSTHAAAVTTPGAVPFGFAITRRNVLVVSEAGTSSASSYRIGEGHAPALTIVSPAVANGEGAACWVAVTPNGRYAYTANAAASSVSSYGIDRQGALTLLAAKAGVMPGANGALDMAVTPDGRQLQVFASRAPQQIVSYRIGADGSLTDLGSVGGVVAGSAGLAAN
jgi:6-phosphogluconolactonase (cycloisomerase 2 family)